ncbi:MAG TPA: class I adenylate-forming enzyme family protein [Polyangiales bacterium]|nr:class I adenylate-forming enzyme family protein [Polyangiales bacterium]
MTQPSVAEVTRELTSAGALFELEERDVGGRRVRYWKNFPRTLAEVVRAALHHSDKTYLVYEDERLNYAQSFERVAALSAHLIASGVRPGDRVAIAMRNLPEWVMAFWASTLTGAVVVPLNAWWKGAELTYGLSDSGSRVLLCDLERAELLASHLPETNVQQVIVARAPLTTPLPEGMLRFEEVWPRYHGAALPELGISPEDDATIFYTSGTTGRPKGALGTHINICSNIGSSMYARYRTAMRNGEDFTQLIVQALSRQPAFLLSVPLFHVTGCHSGLTMNTFMGTKIVMMHKWQPERALELIEREKVTLFGGVPSMVWQVLESPDFARRDLSSVLTVSYGGAPAAPELVRRIKQSFPQSSASNGYGLTETSALACSNAGIDYERKPDSVGVQVALCDIKVVDVDGKELPAGEVGELCIRGANVVRGYFGKPEATALTFRDGWLHTGDVARIDEEGFIYILDRAKDMLIRGGENVYCVEVEDVLYSHPAVMDAAVIGIAHRVLGEEVGAVVQLAPGFTVSAEQLREYAAERLANFKVPVRIELRVEPLPRNPNGKIMKRELKRELGW